jgi:hypothetical protein
MLKHIFAWTIALPILAVFFVFFMPLFAAAYCFCWIMDALNVPATILDRK